MCIVVSSAEKHIHRHEARGFSLLRKVAEIPKFVRKKLRLRNMEVFIVGKSDLL